MKSPRIMVKLIQAMGVMVRAKTRARIRQLRHTRKETGQRGELLPSQPRIDEVEKQIMRVSVSMTISNIRVKSCLNLTLSSRVNI